MQCKKIMAVIQCLSLNLNKRNVRMYKKTFIVNRKNKLKPDLHDLM